MPLVPIKMSELVLIKILKKIIYIVVTHKIKHCNNLVSSHLSAKRRENWYSEGYYQNMCGNLCSCNVQGHFGVIRCTYDSPSFWCQNGRKLEIGFTQSEERCNLILGDTIEIHWYYLHLILQSFSGRYLFAGLFRTFASRWSNISWHNLVKMMAEHFCHVSVVTYTRCNQVERQGPWTSCCCSYQFSCHTFAQYTRVDIRGDRPQCYSRTHRCLCSGDTWHVPGYTFHLDNLERKRNLYCTVSYKFTQRRTTNSLSQCMLIFSVREQSIEYNYMIKIFIYQSRWFVHLHSRRGKGCCVSGKDMNYVTNFKDMCSLYLTKLTSSQVYFKQAWILLLVCMFLFGKR